MRGLVIPPQPFRSQEISNTFCHFIAFHSLQELFHALQSRASGSIDAFVCNAMLAAYVRSADVAAAESLLEDMLQRGPRPPAYSFSIMIDA